MGPFAARGLMRGWAVALVGAACLAGCAEGGNPNIFAPKLVIDARPDGGATVFVHSAFGERPYDALSMSLDNATTFARDHTFSLEERLPQDGFYLEVEAAVAQETYALRARLDILPDREHATVAFVDLEGQWSDAREVNLPFERILERRDTP